MSNLKQLEIVQSWKHCSSVLTKMAASEAAVRPNIRIEIQNNLVEEPMQVDENEDTLNLNSEEEDGEISDGNEQPEPTVSTSQKIAFPNPTSGTRQWPNTEGFETGIDVFDKEEQEKLQVRAERFGINPDESQATNSVQLQDLHDTLGITSESEKNVRFEAIHMNGTDEMSTQDVFVYFEVFAPSSIEWISDTACNVVWNDKISAARALLRLSEPVRGMPVEGPCDPFAEKPEENAASSGGRSILLLGKDREVQMQDNDKENGTAGRIHVSDITVPVPPGYWRLGKPTERSKFILLRFAHRTDKKPFKAERFSQYYKKYGNPNFGGLKGIISESKKKQMKGIFDRHDGAAANRDPEEEPPAAVSGNPWGSLARNWNKDRRLETTPAELSPDPLVSSPVLKSSGMLKRLGHKRAVSSGSESESGRAEAKKSKVPRMRMYADEEEEKIKRKKALKLLKGRIQAQALEEPEKPDLRRKLNQAEPRLRPEVKLEPERDMRDVRNRIPVRREMVNFRIQKRVQAEEHSEPEERSPSESAESESDTDTRQQQQQPVQQKSKVMVIIKKQRQPTVASTVWSRMNADKEAKKTARKMSVEKEAEAEEEGEEDSSSSSEGDADLAANREKLRAAVSRPGFSSGTLKSRLGVKPGEHKSPLRIEINNDLFKAKAAK